MVEWHKPNCESCKKPIASAREALVFPSMFPSRGHWHSSCFQLHEKGMNEFSKKIGFGAYVPGEKGISNEEKWRMMKQAYINKESYASLILGIFFLFPLSVSILVRPLQLDIVGWICFSAMTLLGLALVYAFASFRKNQSELFEMQKKAQ